MVWCGRGSGGLFPVLGICLSVGLVLASPGSASSPGDGTLPPRSAPAPSPGAPGRSLVGGDFLEEGFEGTAFPPPDWTHVSAAVVPYTWHRTQETANVHTGSAAAVVRWQNERVQDELLLSPALDLRAAPPVGLRLSFWWRTNPFWFHGADTHFWVHASLDGSTWDLPVAVTRGDKTALYRLNDRGKLRATGDRLPPRSWLRVRSRRRIGEDAYLMVGVDRLLRESDVLVVEPITPPAEVGEGERWIEIDLTHQVLVAYEWKQPRYVSLVSTGRARASDPALDYRTPVGLYRIRGKHLTSTMDNDEPGEPPYSLEDVPYVMYFKGAYAFHSAFWHDRFGRPRSHGCINLAPRDAKWLYNWAAPDLPESWHGGTATEKNPGAWVYIHGETPGPKPKPRSPARNLDAETETVRPGP